MQFKVPQFLEIEDKIFGPLTFKEFIYLFGGAGLCFIIYKAFGLLIGILPIIAIAGFSLALTFYHPNGKPFLDMVESAAKYAAQSKLYIWKKRKKKIENKPKKEFESNEGINSNQNQTRFGASKLRDLAWSLDVLDLKKEQK